jgi:hypothetical protein
MTSIAQKLNLKTQQEIAVFNVPASFDEDWSALRFGRLEYVKVR